MVNLKYFTFYELCYSATAKSKGIVNVPKDFDTCERLYLLGSHIDKIRETLGEPIKVNSGFRSKELNDLLGGVSNSLHLIGNAVDLSARNFISLRNIIFSYCGFTYQSGVMVYENKYFEVVVYSDRKFIHFALQK